MATLHRAVCALRQTTATVRTQIQRSASTTRYQSTLATAPASTTAASDLILPPAATSATPTSSTLTPPPVPRIFNGLNRVNYTLPKLKKGASTAKTTKPVYPLDSALNLVKSLAKASFDETVSVTVRLNLDPRKPNQSVRGAATLPNGTGKQVRVAVFAKGEKAQEAKAAGADIVGEKDLADSILAGKIDFDRCIATPDMMAFVGRVARILGPRGLMPNPKVGTVTSDVMVAVKAAKMGSVEFKTDKNGVVAVPVGKVSFDAKALYGNIESFFEKIVDLKPLGASKGVYIMSAHVASTHGPGVALDIKAAPFGKVNAASSSGTASESAVATVASGRYGRMHSVNGFNVVRYDLGAHPSAEKIATAKGKWPQVIQQVRASRKNEESWKEVLEKVEKINTSAPIQTSKKAAAPATGKAAKPAKADKPVSDKSEKPAAPTTGKPQ